LKAAAAFQVEVEINAMSSPFDRGRSIARHADRSSVAPVMAIPKRHPADDVEQLGAAPPASTIPAPSAGRRPVFPFACPSERLRVATEFRVRALRFLAIKALLPAVSSL